MFRCWLVLVHLMRIVLESWTFLIKQISRWQYTVPLCGGIIVLLSNLCIHTGIKLILKFRESVSLLAIILLDICCPKCRACIIFSVSCIYPKCRACSFQFHKHIDFLLLLMKIIQIFYSLWIQKQFIWGGTFWHLSGMLFYKETYFENGLCCRLSCKEIIFYINTLTYRLLCWRNIFKHQERLLYKEIDVLKYIFNNTLSEEVDRCPVQRLYLKIISINSSRPIQLPTPSIPPFPGSGVRVGGCGTHLLLTTTTTHVSHPPHKCSHTTRSLASKFLPPHPSTPTHSKPLHLGP